MAYQHSATSEALTVQARTWYDNHDVDDATGPRPALAEGALLAVIGGGWIGLEIAAARSRCVQATAIETDVQPLAESLGPPFGSVFAVALHRDRGVDLRLGIRDEEAAATDGRAAGVRLADGTIAGAELFPHTNGPRPARRPGRAVTGSARQTFWVGVPGTAGLPGHHRRKEQACRKGAP